MELFRGLILERCGIHFLDRREYALARGIQAATERAGIKSRRDYYRLLRDSDTDSALWEELLNLVTVGETYFFRDESQMDALRRHVLPGIISSRSRDRRLRIWSAGCATGEEPYTLAILLRELLPAIESWNIHILATDINKKALEQARRGEFREWSFRRASPKMKKRYFTERDGRYRLSEQIRRMVTFLPLNLAEDVYPSLATDTVAMDLILCRNVVLYLREAVIRQTMERFHRALLPGGWLVVSAAETPGAGNGLFIPQSFPGAILYQKGMESPPREEAPVRISVPPPSLAPPLPAPLERPAPMPAAAVPVPAPSPEAKAPSEEEVIAEGTALMGQSFYEKALALFETRLSQDPDNPRLLHLAARAHANMGRLQQAGALCRKALARDPLLEEAQYTMALILQEAGELENALVQLKKTLYLDGDFVLAHFSLSHLYARLGKMEESARHRVQALRLACGLESHSVVRGSERLTAAQLRGLLRAERGDGGGPP
jgi:chemotaxis protein methyltransferase CheR